MTIVCLFVQRKCRYPGEYAPELYEAIDEIGNSDNPDFLIEAASRAKADSDIEFHRIISVNIDGKDFNKSFWGSPLEGKIDDL